MAYAAPGRAACHDKLVIGEDLRSTITTANAEPAARTADSNAQHPARVGSICAIFVAAGCRRLAAKAAPA
jgi:hypothetical protein